MPFDCRPEMANIFDVRSVLSHSNTWREIDEQVLVQTLDTALDCCLFRTYELMAEERVAFV